MENVQIRDEDGNLIVEFDGEEWKIDSEYGYGEPKTLYHDLVKTSPFYLFQELEELGDAAELMIELSQKSIQLKELVDNFFVEKIRLKRRTVLYKKYDSGMFDEFTDFLTLSGNTEVGFIVETSIETDLSDEECERNALGEMTVERVENIFDAKQLYEGIVEVTSDRFNRWENINWKWKKVIPKLETLYPKLAEELTQIVEKDKEK